MDAKFLCDFHKQSLVVNIDGLGRFNLCDIKSYPINRWFWLATMYKTRDDEEVHKFLQAKLLHATDDEVAPIVGDDRHFESITLPEHPYQIQHVVVRSCLVEHERLNLFPRE